MSHYNDHLTILLPLWAKKFAEAQGYGELTWCEYLKEKIDRKLKKLDPNSELHKFNAITASSQSDGFICLKGDAVFIFEDVMQEDRQHELCMSIYQIILDLQTCNDISDVYLTALKDFTLDEYSQSIIFCQDTICNVLTVRQEMGFYSDTRPPIVGYEIIEKTDRRSRDDEFYGFLMDMSEGSRGAMNDLSSMRQIFPLDALEKILTTMIQTSYKRNLYSNNVLLGVLDIYQGINSFSLLSVSQNKQSNILRFSQNIQKNPALLQTLGMFIMNICSEHEEILTLVSYMEITNLLEMIQGALSLLSDVERKKILTVEAMKGMEYLREKMKVAYQRFLASESFVQNQSDMRVVTNFKLIEKRENKSCTPASKSYAPALSSTNIYAVAVDDNMYDNFEEDGDNDLFEELEGMHVGFDSKEIRDAEMAQRERENEAQRQKEYDIQEELARRIKEEEKISEKAHKKAERERRRNRPFSEEEYNIISCLSKDHFESLKRFSAAEYQLSFAQKKDVETFNAIIVSINDNLYDFETRPVETEEVMDHYKNILDTLMSLYKTNKRLASGSTKNYNFFISNRWESFQLYYNHYFRNSMGDQERGESQRLKNEYFETVRNAASAATFQYSSGLFATELQDSFLPDAYFNFLKKIKQASYKWQVIGVTEDNIVLLNKILAFVVDEYFKRLSSIGKGRIQAQDKEMLNRINEACSALLSDKKFMGENVSIKISEERPFTEKAFKLISDYMPKFNELYEEYLEDLECESVSNSNLDCTK